MDQDKGTSLVMINSEKGKDFFDGIKNEIVCKEFTMEDARKGNPAIYSSLKNTGTNRDKFFSDLDKYSFDVVAKRNFPMPTIKNKAMAKIRRIAKCGIKAMSVIQNLGFSFSGWNSFFMMNVISNKAVRNCRLPYLGGKQTIVQLDKGSCIQFNQRLKTGIRQVKKSSLQTRILLEHDSCLVVNGCFSVYAGSYIRLLPNSRLILNGGFINENVQITVGDTIEIGEGATIGRDVVIRSYDGHTIDTPGYRIRAD